MEIGLGVWEGVQEDRADHTKLLRRSFTGFGFTRHQKVHFSTFDGKLTFQCTKSCSPGHLYYLFLDISPTNISKIFCKKKNLDYRTSEHLKIQKPRFTNRSPERGLWRIEGKSNHPCCHHAVPPLR